MLEKMKTTNKIKFNTKRARLIPIALMAMCLIMCVGVTFAWYGSSVEYLNTTIKMGDFSANVTVFDENDKVISAVKTNGQDVKLDNKVSKDENWSSGSTGFRLIKIDNTGTIDLGAYLLCNFSLDGFVYENPSEITDAFYFNLKDVTDQVVKASSPRDFAKEYSVSADDLSKSGLTFTKFDTYKELGKVDAGKTSYFVLEYCCYNLGQTKFIEGNSISISSIISIQQAKAPVDESVYTNIKSLTNQMIMKPEVTQPTQVEDVEVKTQDKKKETTDKKDDKKETNKSSDNVVDGWKWEYNSSDKKSAAIVKYSGKDTSVIVPGKINGVIITELKDNVFKGTKVSKVEIPATVSSIAPDALVSDNISKIIINESNSVDSKVYYSPYSCQGLVILNKDKKVLVRYLPQASNTEYFVPSTVDVIADNAFSNTKNLKVLNMADISIVMASAFKQSSIDEFNIYSLTPPTIYASNTFANTTGHSVSLNVRQDAYDKYMQVTEYQTFADMNTLSGKLTTDNAISAYPEVYGQTYTDQDGIVYAYFKSGTKYLGRIYSSDAPYTAVVIGYAGDENVKSITISKSPFTVSDRKCYVAGIVDGAFKNLPELEEVNISDSDIFFTKYAFENCKKLTSVKCEY